MPKNYQELRNSFVQIAEIFEHDLSKLDSFKGLSTPSTIQREIEYLKLIEQPLDRAIGRGWRPSLTKNATCLSDDAIV